MTKGQRVFLAVVFVGVSSFLTGLLFDLQTTIAFLVGGAFFAVFQVLWGE